MKIIYLLPFLFGFSFPAFSQQLISDKQIGKTLGQVICGERDMNKIQNVTNYPAIVAEFKWYQRRYN